MIVEILTLATDAPAPNRISEAQYLSALIGVFLPILVGFITKASTSPKIKSVLLLVTSAISAFLTEWLAASNADQVFNWQQALYGVILTFVTGVATLHGLWNPTGVRGAAERHGNTD